MILCIETSGDICSAALCSSKSVISERQSAESKSHATQLTVFIEELLREQNIRASELRAVAVGKGPGSFTGLRIGVAVAKGIAYGAGIPLIGVDSLTAMFFGFTESEEGKRYTEPGTLFCPVIDAKRMEVYYCLFGPSGEKLSDISAGMIEKERFSAIAADKRVVFFGSGSDKLETMSDIPGAVFIKGFEISASFLRIPAFRVLKNNIFENTISFEPFYLKDFVTTKPGKKII